MRRAYAAARQNRHDSENENDSHDSDAWSPDYKGALPQGSPLKQHQKVNPLTNHNFSNNVTTATKDGCGLGLQRKEPLPLTRSSAPENHDDPPQPLPPLNGDASPAHVAKLPLSSEGIVDQRSIDHSSTEDPCAGGTAGAPHPVVHTTPLLSAEPAVASEEIAAGETTCEPVMVQDANDAAVSIECRVLVAKEDRGGAIVCTIKQIWVMGWDTARKDEEGFEFEWRGHAVSVTVFADYNRIICTPATGAADPGRQVCRCASHHVVELQ